MNDNVDTANSRLYGYDAQGRLETASGPWGSGSFTYDSVGNIRAKSLGGRNITLDYTDGRNRVTKSTDSGETGIRNITYDDRGNVEYLGEQRFLYTATDRPRVRRSTAAGNGFGKCRYDGHGRRVSSWEREDGEWAYRYNAYDASGALVFVVEEGDRFPFNDTITHYVKQDGKTVARVKSTSLNTTPEITWLHHDHLGSAVAGTKADGTTAWTEKYTPFGISIVDHADNDNQAGFTGHIKDSDTGLTYMQARYYDPVIGWFLSIDPVTFMDTGDPNFFNRYTYAFNDPINIIDPTGMAGCSDRGAQGLSGTCFDSSNFRTEDKKGFFGTSKANDFSGDAVGTASTDSAATSFVSSTNQKTGNEQVSRIDTNPDGTSTTSNVPLTSSSSSSAAFKPSEVAGADGVVHTHPTNKNTPVPGAGDSQVPEMGIPNYIAHGSNTVIAVEISGGQVRGRVVSGKLGSTDRKALRSRLNQFQRRGETR